MLKKRALSALLALIMTAQLLPAAALADDGADETEEEIRQTLLDSVTEEEYPNGMFDFLTPRMETSEDVGEAEFAMSEITDVSGTEIPAENTDNRSLISADFDFNVERYTVSLEDIDDIDAGAEDTYVDVIVKNESILTNSDVSVALYMTQNGEESLIGEATIDEIIGGGTEAVAIPWDVPDELDGVVLTAKVNMGGETLCEASESLEYDGMIEITELSHEMLDRNTAELTVGVKNTGSENAKAERVYVNCGGTQSVHKLQH